MKAYKSKDFLNIDNFNIIKEVREFRFRIKATYDKLGELDELFGDLNTTII